MAHQHSPRFLQIVNEAKQRIREVAVDDVKARQDKGEDFLLVDVREESEFAKDHLPMDGGIREWREKKLPLVTS